MFQKFCLVQCNSLFMRGVFNHKNKFCKGAWCRHSSPSVMLFDSSHLLDISGHCSVAPRMAFGVTRQRSFGTLWQALIFQVPLMGLVPFQTKRFKIFRGMWSTSGKRCRSKNVLWYLTTRNTSFYRSIFPLTVCYCIFWCFLSSQTREGGAFVENFSTGNKTPT